MNGFASSSTNVTPLERSLSPLGGRATPLDALRLAQEALLAGDTLDMGVLAARLGLSRATLYRWVGSKERLLGEVLWSMAADAMDAAVEEASGSGPEFVAEVIERYMTSALRFEPLWRFVARDPEYALRVLASRHSPMQRRSIAAVQRVLDEQASAGAIEPALALDKLAYLIVRIVESFLYTDVITGGEPDVGAATDAVRALLSAPRA
jgi:AcrR family transcriptional regulator